MKTWERAESLIASSVIGAPWPSVEAALRTAARDYFNQTMAWRAPLDPQLSIVGQVEYDAVEETGAEPIKILTATFDKSPLTPLTTREFMIERAQEPGNGPPQWVSFDGESLLVWPAPAVAGRKIYVEAAFRPTMTAKGLPDDVWAEHVDAIVHGAKWQLKSMNDLPFTDSNGAERSYRLFRGAMATAAVAATKGYTRARTNARARFF